MKILLLSIRCEYRHKRLPLPPFLTRLYCLIILMIPVFFSFLSLKFNQVLEVGTRAHYEPAAIWFLRDTAPNNSGKIGLEYEVPWLMRWNLKMFPHFPKEKNIGGCTR